MEGEWYREDRDIETMRERNRVKEREKNNKPRERTRER